jgi:hypothetical protein
MSAALVTLLALVAHDTAASTAAAGQGSTMASTPLALCTRQAKADLDGGARCLRQLVDAGAADAADAAEALRVLHRLRRHRTPAPPSPPRLTLTSAWAPRGVVEAGLHGVALGGVGGFAGASAVVAGLRTSEADSLPWLVVAPAIGAAAGGAVAVAGVTLSNMPPDDIALVASTSWAGVALSTGATLAALSGSVDVAAPALGFATVLAGGAVGLVGGLVLAPSIDATAGDVAVANSGLVWGGVLGGLGAVSVRDGTAAPTFGDVALWTTAGAGAAWLSALALHPWLSLHRVSAWLVDAGGVAGLLLAASALAATGQSVVGSPGSVSAVLFAGTSAGLAAGAVAAVHVDARFGAGFEDPAAPPPLLSRIVPAVLPTPAGRTAAGVIVEVARW